MLGFVPVMQTHTRTHTHIAILIGLELCRIVRRVFACHVFPPEKLNVYIYVCVWVYISISIIPITVDYHVCVCICICVCDVFVCMYEICFFKYISIKFMCVVYAFVCVVQECDSVYVLCAYMLLCLYEGMWMLCVTLHMFICQ